MLPEDLKAMLNSDSKSIIAPKFSRKTIVLKKRNKALSITNDQPTYILSQSKTPLNVSPNKILKQEQNQINTNQTNSVSCQTSASLLDEQIEISPDDPIWQEIIPQELLQNSSVEQLLEDNRDYFYYLLGLYLQEQMYAGNMNKFIMPTKYLTQYSRDFPTKTLDKPEVIKNTIYQDYKSQQNSQFSKTMYSSQFSAYPPKDYLIKEKQQKKYEKSELEFATLTTYKANHFDYKNYEKPEKFTSSKHCSTGGLQKTSQSMYKTEYQWPQQLEQNKSCKNTYSKLNPIQSSGIFFDKQQQGYFQYPLEQIEKNSQFIPTPTYKGQYQTMSKRFFNNTQIDDYSGTRIGDVTQMKNWRQSVIRRMNQLRRQSQ